MSYTPLVPLPAYCMTPRRLLFLLLAVLSTTGAGIVPAYAQAEAAWTQLFNGRDLSGWDTYLGQPPDSNGVIGLNADPLQVFTVQDGMIRISGLVWGALTSHGVYDNYHLRLEFKWGEQRWPPREHSRRDSGLLYHAVGPHGAQSGHWMRSHELQIQETDTGDYHSLDGALIDIAVDTVFYDGAHHLRYTPGGTRRTGVHQRVIKQADHERPYGAWNTVEVIAEGDTATHLVNGEVVLQLFNSRQVIDGREVPLTRGRIQIQSEGAEIWIRKVELRPL